MRRYDSESDPSITWLTVEATNRLMRVPGYGPHVTPESRERIVLPGGGLIPGDQDRTMRVLAVRGLN